MRKATGITLDYTPETLPVLDHYLQDVPRGRPELLALIAETTAAYFGEVVRKAFGGTWGYSGRLELDGGIVFSPEAMAAEAIARAPIEDVDSEFAVPEETREAVEDALTRAGPVDEDEYYSLSGRFEAMLLVVHTVAGAKARSMDPSGQSEDQSETSPTRTTPDTDDISSPAGSAPDPEE